MSGCSRWDRDEAPRRTQVVCPKHGKVAECAKSTNLFSIGCVIFCPECVVELLSSQQINPLKETYE
jgi:hypothetical protein